MAVHLAPPLLDSCEWALILIFHSLKIQLLYNFFVNTSDMKVLKMYNIDH